MNVERWERLKEVFEAARLLDPQSRAVYLADACADDPETRREAESLLLSLEAAESFIERPPTLLADLEQGDPQLGRRLGPWRIEGLLGRGGMGAVYRAVRDDDEFRKAAAVKLLPAGAESTLVAARFRAERQILARLDHPGIARLLDGGTTEDGRPFLVMELVEGEWIDRYCDRRGLGARERLALFANVCDAVQYAHQCLVVHRDIKPGNIMVQADGTPKLLDFGIAKLLGPGEPGAPATVTELRALTPRYASPEQVTGGPITTASDVYSLGVLLYELLAGVPPYEIRTHTQQELLRVVCGQEPPRPSLAARARPPDAPGADDPAAPESGATAALAHGGGREWGRVSPREIEGDPDWIVMKALRKEPGRRYASAQEMADDIRRHLTGLPVRARPDTMRYRAGKFVRRHRVGVSAAVLLVLSLAGGLAATLWQWRRAEAAHRQAEQRFADLRRLAGSLLFEVHDAIENLPGSTKARELIVKRGVEYLDRIAASSVDDEVKAELAAGYVRLGDVQGRAGESSLGDVAAALDSYRKAVRLAEGLAASRQAPASRRELLAQAYGRLSEALQDTGDRPGASVAFARSVSLLEAVVAGDPQNPRLRARLAALRLEQGGAHADGGRWDEALAAYARSAELYEALAGQQPQTGRHRRNLALAYKYMGGALQKLRRMGEARGLFEKAVVIDRDLAAANPNDASARLDLSYDVASLARLDHAGDRLEAALAGLTEALALRRSVLEADPANAQARTAVARAHSALAAVQRDRGERLQAEAHFRRSVAEWETLAAGSPGAVAPRLAWAKDLVGLADLLAEPARGSPSAQSARRRAEGCTSYRRALQVASGIRDDLPSEDRSWCDTLAARVAGCDGSAGATSHP